MGAINERERAFTGAMLEIFKRTLGETGYRASMFFNMINDQGGLGAAQQLIRATRPSDGYTKLHLLKRLDLTVEAVVLRREWDDLFDDDDRSAAWKRLADYKYEFPSDVWMPLK
jgi:hypothetical protein